MAPAIPHKKARSILWCPGNRQFFRTRLVEQVSLSGKSPVFPDKVGQTIVSIRKIASFSGQALSEGFLRSAQPLRSEGHGICRMVRRWPSTTLFTEWDFWWTNHDSNTTLSTKSALWWTNRSLRTTLSTESAFWWTNRSFSNASEMRQSSNPNRQTMIQIGTRCSRRDDLWSHRLQLKLTYC